MSHDAIAGADNQKLTHVFDYIAAGSVLDVHIISGEMSTDDFYHGEGLPFFRNFRGLSSYTYNSPEYQAYKEGVIATLGEQLKGPFFSIEIMDGETVTLEIAILQRSDCVAFAQEHPEFYRDMVVEDENRATGLARFADGWTTDDPRLKHWLNGISTGARSERVGPKPS